MNLSKKLSDLLTPNPVLARLIADLAKPRTDLAQMVAGLSTANKNLTQMVAGLNKPNRALSQMVEKLKKPNPALSQMVVGLTKTNLDLSQMLSGMAQPNQRLAKIVSDLAKPNPSLARMIANLSKPDPALSLVVSRLTKPNPAFAQIASDFSKPSQRLAQMIAGLTKPNPAFTEMIAGLTDSNQRLATMVAGLSKPDLRFNEMIEALRMAQASFEVPENGEGYLDAAANHFSESWSSTETENFWEKMDVVITSALEKKNSGLLSNQAFQIVLTVALNLISSFIFMWLMTPQPEPIQSTPAQLVREADATIDSVYSHLLDTSDIAIVKRPVDVKVGIRRRSVVLDTLYPGSVVRVIDKKKKWRLVEWYHHDCDLMVSGWVRAKYLR